MSLRSSTWLPGVLGSVHTLASFPGCVVELRSSLGSIHCLHLCDHSLSGNLLYTQCAYASCMQSHWVRLKGVHWGCFLWAFMFQEANAQAPAVGRCLPQKGKFSCGSQLVFKQFRLALPTYCICIDGLISASLLTTTLSNQLEIHPIP